MSLLSVFTRRMKESQLDASVLLETNSTADKSPEELSAIVAAQAKLLVAQKDLLQQQRQLIADQKAQLKIQDQLIVSQKAKIAELQSKPAPKAPAKPKETPKAQVEETPKADPTAQILKKLFGGKV